MIKIFRHRNSVNLNVVELFSKLSRCEPLFQIQYFEEFEFITPKMKRNISVIEY
jgi:hypothetical protein